MDWDGARVIHKEDNKHQRWVMEAGRRANILCHTWSSSILERRDRLTSQI